MYWSFDPMSDRGIESVAPAPSQPRRLDIESDPRLCPWVCGVPTCEARCANPGGHWSRLLTDRRNLFPLLALLLISAQFYGFQCALDTQQLVPNTLYAIN